MLHDIQADTKDIQLKTAFHECPVALQDYKIRSLGAFDAMAGELKYHQSCWDKIIVNRQVESLFFFFSIHFNHVYFTDYYANEI